VHGPRIHQIEAEIAGTGSMSRRTKRRPGLQVTAGEEKSPDGVDLCGQNLKLEKSLLGGRRKAARAHLRRQQPGEAEGSELLKRMKRQREKSCLDELGRCQELRPKKKLDHEQETETKSAIKHQSSSSLGQKQKSWPAKIMALLY
jgi:hypothetical protein